jgi:hypothetical protein
MKCRIEKAYHIFSIVYSTILTILLGIIIFSNSYYSDEKQQVLATSINNNNNNDNSNSRVSITIEGLSVDESATGLVLVTGTVYNNYTANVGDVKIRVELFDISNTLVRETERFVTPPSSTLEPEEREGFNFLMQAERFDHYNVIAYGTIG